MDSFTLFDYLPSENFSKNKKTLNNAFQKIKTLFLRKENVPKWNDQEHMLLVLKRFLSALDRFLFFQISYIFGHIVDHQRIDS